MKSEGLGSTMKIGYITELTLPSQCNILSPDEFGDKENISNNKVTEPLLQSLKE